MPMRQNRRSGSREPPSQELPIIFVSDLVTVPVLFPKKEVIQETIKSQNTFQAIAGEWIEQQGEKWSINHTKAVLKTLERDAFPLIGDIRIDSLTPPQILKVIRTIEARGSYEIASKVLQRISAVCRYAVQTGKAMYNPAADMRGVLKTRRVVHREVDVESV